MQLARDEIGHWQEFDHVVVNDDFDRAVATVRPCCTPRASRPVRQTGLQRLVRRLCGTSNPDTPPI